jgi:hypothetical protein
MGKFFSLWSEPRLKKPGMEGKRGGPHEENCQDCQKSPKWEKQELPWISGAYLDSLVFVFLRVLCGYFFFFVVDDFSGCAPVTLASTWSNASLAVIFLLRLLFCRYLCSLLQVRQRVLSTSSPIMETIEWSVVRLQREQ